MNFDPYAGLPPNLVPTPPAAMPEAPGVPETRSPFVKPLDASTIIDNLSLDRELVLFIPNRDKYPQHEFRIINDTPQEYADAARKGFQPVDDPELVRLFEGKVSGTDKTGKVTKPVLVARPLAVGDAVRKQIAQRVDNLKSSMDPKRRKLNVGDAEKYASIVDSLSNFSIDRRNI